MVDFKKHKIVPRYNGNDRKFPRQRKKDYKSPVIYWKTYKKELISDDGNKKISYYKND